MAAGLYGIVVWTDSRDAEEIAEVDAAVLTDDLPEGGGRGADPQTVDLLRALQQLAPRERECVVLRHYLDQSERQTAEALGVSVGAVKAYTSRGLAALRPLMQDQEDHHVRP